MEDEQGEGIMTSHAIQNIIMSWSCGTMQTQAIKILSLKSRNMKKTFSILVENYEPHPIHKSITGKIIYAYSCIFPFFF